MADKLSSLTVLMVSDLKESQRYYREVLGFDVTDWWAERGGLQGVALKLLQAPDAADVRPNPAPAGGGNAVDVQVYVENWTQLDALYAEFRRNGAAFSMETAVYEDFGPWKEFIVEDPDGYHLAFGGVDGKRSVSPIHPQYDSVFLWVRRLDRAVERYGKLLGLEAREQDRYGHLHRFRLDDNTDLLLDSNGMENVPVPERGPVVCKFPTPDIDAAHRHALACGFEVIGGIERLPQVSFFNVRDEDGNVLMICQDHK